MNGGPWSLVSTSASYQHPIAAQASYDLELQLEATSFYNTVVDSISVVVEPAVPVSVSIGGEDHVLPNQSNEAGCLYQAVVADGYGPRTYEWKRNGLVVSTDELYLASTGTTDYFLELEVTDLTGNDTDNMLVDVDGSGVSCL